MGLGPNFFSLGEALVLIFESIVNLSLVYLATKVILRLELIEFIRQSLDGARKKVESRPIGALAFRLAPNSSLHSINLATRPSFSLQGSEFRS